MIVKKSSGLLLASISLILSQARTEAAEPAQSDNLDEIVITASRIAREGFTAPTPTTIIGEELMQSRATTNVIDVINETPSFRNTQTQQAQSLLAGAGGAQVDLRGLGTVRTLLLVNGQRHVPTSPTGSVDLNMIPTGLIQRVEVVTGGASAAWGSDAVAGVVNVILKDKLQGIQGNVALGRSSKNDFDEQSVNLSGGTAFADGRGHVIAGGEYFYNKGVGLVGHARDWSRENWGTVTPTGAGRPAGTPSRVVAPYVYFSDLLSPGGVVVGAAAGAANGGFNSLPLDNLKFLSGGGTGTFQNGSIYGGALMVGGENVDNQNSGGYTANPLKRYSALSRVSFDINDSLSVFGQASFAHADFDGLGAQRRDQGVIRIYGGNPYLLAAAPGNAAIASMTSSQSFLMGRLLEEIGHYKNHSETETIRFVAGVEGKFGDGWTWDAYYQKGKNQFDQRNQTTISSNFFAATDAIAGPGGTVICNPTYRGPALPASAPIAPDPGCVPINIFGEGSPSAAALAYITGYSVYQTVYKQDAAAVNLSGEPFSNWAGPVSVAAGLEYRKESINSVPDLNAQRGRFDLYNRTIVAGEVKVKELYAETVIPIANNKFLLKTLDLNAAARRTDYSTSGGVTTWKAGLTYEPNSDFRVRATKSRDIRAPNVNELFAGPTSLSPPIRNPATNTTIFTRVWTGSNANLLPEEADTFTGGLVFTPSWLPGVRASLDYFDIKISGVISSLGGQSVVDRCFTPAGSTTVGTTPQGNSYCPLVIFDPSGGIAEVFNSNLNLNFLNTDGYDFELSYNVPSLFKLPGNLSIRTLITKVNSLVTIDSVGAIDRVKQTVPEWAANVGFTYTLDRFSSNLQYRYIGPTVRDVTLVGPDRSNYSPTLPNSINDNTNPSVSYVNWSAQYKLSTDTNITVYGAVNNLFDQDPPDGSTNNALGGLPWDLVGRAFKIGARFDF